MADITMCTNKECPKAKECYRILAKPSEWRQSYTLFDCHDSNDYKYFYPMPNERDRKFIESF